MMMVLAFLFSMILGREKDVWSTLALAALVVLAVDPHAIFAISFQLSFLAVVGILWLAPWIFSVISFKAYDIRKGVLYRFYVYFCGLASVTISAMLFLLPVTSFYFHRVSLVSLLGQHDGAAHYGSMHPPPRTPGGRLSAVIPGSGRFHPRGCSMGPGPDDGLCRLLESLSLDRGAGVQAELHGNPSFLCGSSSAFFH